MGFSAKQVQTLRRELDGRPARPMVVSSPILKVGTRYQKPIGFLDLMAGTGRP